MLLSLLTRVSPYLTLKPTRYSKHRYNLWETRERTKQTSHNNVSGIFRLNLNLILLQLFEPLPPSSDVLLPALQALQTVHFVTLSRCIDVSHSSKRSLYSTGDLSQQSLKVGHPLLIYHYPASLVVWITVSKHKNIFHDGLCQKVWLLRAHLCA